MKSLCSKIVATLLSLCLFVILAYFILQVTGALEYGSYRESSVPCVILFMALLLTWYAIWRKRKNIPEE